MEEKERKTILWILFLGVLMGALDIAIVGPALPAIKSMFNVSERSLSWIFTIYILFNILGTPLMAKLSDKYGRRLIYIIDLTLFGIGSIVTVSSSLFILFNVSTPGMLMLPFYILIIGRAIQGFGSGGIFPVASAVIGDTFPKEKQGSALGLIGAVFGLAFIIGPILGGIFLRYGWQWLFLINIPFVIVIIILGRKRLPSKTKEESIPFDKVGMTSIFIVLGTLALGINLINESNFIKSFLSYTVWPFFAVFLIFIFVVIRIEKKAKDPIINLKLFQNKQLLRVNLLTIGGGFSEATLVFLPTMAIVAFNVSESTASFMIIPLVIAMSIGSPLVGRLLDKMGPKYVILIGTLILTAGLMLTGFLGNIIAIFFLGTILMGIGLISLIGAPLRYIVLKESPESERGSFQGVLAIFTGIGQLISGALMGGLIASLGGGLYALKVTYIVVGIISILLIIGATGIKKYKITDNKK